MQPTVSIVMPARNAAATIVVAIESVLKQSHRDWELIVVNDGSEDDTAKLLRSYVSDPRIHLISNTRSEGVALARNEAIERARGRFMAFLDADDAWLPEKLEMQVAFEVPAPVVFGPYYLANSALEGRKLVVPPAVCDYSQLLRGNCIGNLTAIYDVAACGKVYQKQRPHEDYLMWLDILRPGRIARSVRAPLAIYRKHRKSLSGSKIQSAVWQWKLLRDDLGITLPRRVALFSQYVVQGLRKHVQ